MKNIIKEHLSFFIAMLGVAIMLYFSSCLTPNKIAKICATCPAVSIYQSDSIVHENKPFDTTIYIKRYGEDIAVKFNTMYGNSIKDLIDRLQASNDTISTLKNGIKTSLIKTTHGFKCKCAADSLMVILQLERENKTVYKVKTIVKEVPKHCPPCNIKHRNRADGFYFYFSWIVIIYIALINLKRIIKFIKAYFTKRF